MSVNLPAVTISAAAFQLNTASIQPTDVAWLEFLNESPYTLTVTMGGWVFVIPAWYDYPVQLTDASSHLLINSIAFPVQVTPSLLGIITSVAAQSSVLIATIYSPGERPVVMVPTPLARQPAQTGILNAGNAVFSATAGFGGTTGARQKLNVYNPPNSGVTMTFHSARVFDDNSTSSAPTANLSVINGADLNLAGSVPITSHTGTASPPVSVGHASEEDVAIQPIPGTTLEVMDMAANVTQDFLAYPDTVQLLPGNNLLIDLAQTGTGHIVRLTMKWSEAPSVIPLQVINMTTQTASNIINDGNATGTGIIESTPSGVAQTAHVTNDGLWILGVNQSGTVHQFLKTQASGNPLQLGQSGDTTEVLGAFAVDQNLIAGGGMNINTIRDNVNGNAAIDLSAGDGTASFPQIVKPNAAGTVHNGSVSGNATLYTPVWGSTLKIIMLVFNNYQSASSFTFSLPGTINFANLLSGNFGTETVTPQLSGVNSNGSAITTLASGGGTFVGVGSIAKGIIGELAGPTNQLLISSNAAAVSRMLLIIGV